MTTGGPDDSIFRYSNEGSGELNQIKYPELAYLLWVLFIAIMVILFLNFVVSTIVIFYQISIAAPSGVKGNFVTTKLKSKATHQLLCRHIRIE